MSKIFPGVESQIALTKVSFNLESGGIAALYGPSGSGKSTVLNLASGMDRPTEGSVRISEDDITLLSASELTLYRRQHMGFIFQSYNLFPSLSALENVEIIDLLNGVSADLARKKAHDALEKVGLKDRALRLPGQLSGGQQQRVAVARAISSNPEVLFADEPTANLDSKTALSLIDLFFELNKIHGTTILFSTHDSNILNRVPQLIKLKDGTLELS